MTTTRKFPLQRDALRQSLTQRQAVGLRSLERAESGLLRLTAALHLDQAGGIRLVPGEVDRGIRQLEKGVRELEFR